MVQPIRWISNPIARIYYQLICPLSLATFMALPPDNNHHQPMPSHAPHHFEAPTQPQPRRSRCCPLSSQILGFQIGTSGVFLPNQSVPVLVLIWSGGWSFRSVFNQFPILRQCWYQCFWDPLFSNLRPWCQNILRPRYQTYFETMVPT